MKFCEEIVDVQVSNFGNGCISYMTGHLAQSNAFESAWVVTTVNALRIDKCSWVLYAFLLK